MGRILSNPSKNGILLVNCDSLFQVHYEDH